MLSTRECFPVAAGIVCYREEQSKDVAQYTPLYKNIVCENIEARNW